MLHKLRHCLASALVCGAVALGLFCNGGSLQAGPVHKRALADYFGPFLVEKFNDCRTCHVAGTKTEADVEATEKPHNPFGARLAAVKAELKKAGKGTTLADRLEAIA